jgi:hypothetical protein
VALSYLAPYFGPEPIEGLFGVLAAFCHPNFLEIHLGFWLSRFWQFIQHIHGFMHPAALLPRGAELFFKRLPKTERAVADGQLRRNGKASGLEVSQQFAPGLGAFTIARLEADQFLLAFWRRPDQHQDSLLVRVHAGLKVDAVRPDIDIAASGEIARLPALIFLLPARLQPGEPPLARDSARPCEAASASCMSPVAMPRR